LEQRAGKFDSVFCCVGFHIAEPVGVVAELNQTMEPISKWLQDLHEAFKLSLQLHARLDLVAAVEEP